MTILLSHPQKLLFSNIKNTFQCLRKHLHKILPKVKKELPPVTTENQYEILSRVVAPLWDMDYVEQLMVKKKWSRDVVGTIKSRRIARCKTRIHEILPSPLIESYRSKDEFSIRQGVDGNDKTVGFFIGSPADGNVVCVQPTKLVSLKDSHMLLAEVFQQLIRDSPLKACHDLHDGGYWRNLIVRSNRKNEIIVIAVVHPAGASPADMEESKLLLRDRLLSAEANVKGLCFQSCQNVRCTNDQAPMELLFGEKYLYETIDDISVRISPDSFMQVNIDAAETLYNAALGFANLTNKTTVLDLCSGTGIISLLASRQARGCVGIEFVASAVEDAIFSASYNNITNCNFIQGRVEKKLKSVLKELNLASDLVAFINPGRAGISHNILKMLRRSTLLRRIIYISCKADHPNSLRNFEDLCSPSFDKSAPFLLTDVQPVDMFPLTEHCELILVFQRLVNILVGLIKTTKSDIEILWIRNNLVKIFAF